MIKKIFKRPTQPQIRSDYAEFSRTAKASDRKKRIKTTISRANELQKETARAR